MIISKAQDIKTLNQLRQVLEEVEKIAIKEINNSKTANAISNELEMQALLGKSQINMPKITCMQDALEYAGIKVQDISIDFKPISMAEQLMNYEKKIKGN